ncbi:MAG: cytochrome c, partial [Variovorax sp.]|nr:cytochrome c [Variovorax sp.]
MIRFASLALAAACAVMSLPAAAQFAKPEDAIKYRQSALFVMGQHFGRLGAMANGRVP